MSNSINWTGNRVLDGGAPRQSSSASPPASAPSVRTPAPAPTVRTPAPAYIPPEDPGVDLSTVQGPPPATQEGFIPYYLASNIGRPARAEFIVGASQYMDKTGVIKEVGVNYFVLHDTNARADVMCDLYSVKFVTIPRP